MGTTVKSDDRKPYSSVLYRCAGPITILNMLLLVACTVQPEVKYLTDPVSDMTGFTKFHLVDSHILISAAKDEKGLTPTVEPNSKADLSKIVASAVPKEATDHLYAIVPQSQYWGLVTTTISSTFYDNTRLVNKVGVEVIDNRVKAIEAIGAIAVVAAMAALHDNIHTLAVPIVINPREGKVNEWQPLPRNPAWAYRLTTTPEEDKDSVPREPFFTQHDGKINGKEATAAFPVSSCKSMKLELATFPKAKLQSYLDRGKSPSKNERVTLAQNEAESLAKSPDKKLDFLLKLPDPTRVRLIQMPPKGEITTHTLCGANTSMQSASTSNALDLVVAFMKQVQAVFEAQKEKDKEG